MAPAWRVRAFGRQIRSLARLVRLWGLQRLHPIFEEHGPRLPHRGGLGVAANLIMELGDQRDELGDRGHRGR
jgi:hypothetical protein